MFCDNCKKERFRLRSVGDFKFVCSDCIRIPRDSNIVISRTVTFHDADGKPIKATEARINMIKSRYLSSEDGVTVLMKDSRGKKTDRRGYNY